MIFLYLRRLANKIVPVLPCSSLFLILICSPSQVCASGERDCRVSFWGCPRWEFALPSEGGAPGTRAERGAGQLECRKGEDAGTFLYSQILQLPIRLHCRYRNIQAGRLLSPKKSYLWIFFFLTTQLSWSLIGRLRISFLAVLLICVKKTPICSLSSKELKVKWRTFHLMKHAEETNLQTSLIWPLGLKPRGTMWLKVNAYFT